MLWVHEVWRRLQMWWRHCQLGSCGCIQNPCLQLSCLLLFYHYYMSVSGASTLSPAALLLMSHPYLLWHPCCRRQSPCGPNLFRCRVVLLDYPVLIHRVWMKLRRWDCVLLFQDSEHYHFRAMFGGNPCYFPLPFRPISYYCFHLQLSYLLLSCRC